MKSIAEIARQIREVTQRESTDTSSNIEADALAPLGDPDCELCGGMGYIRLDVPVEHPHFGKLFPCTCRMADLQAQRTESMRLMSNLHTLERFTFDNFNPQGHGLSPERQRNLRHAYEASRAYANKPEGWLLLLGGYGSGKTHLAAAIANVAVERGLLPLFVTVPDLLDHLRAAFAPNARTGYSDRFEQVRTTPLLIMDDLGTENATPWALEKLFQLLNYRYMAKLPTVITTNLALEDMDARLRSRLADPAVVEIVSILAPDFRQSGVDRDASDLNTLPFYGGLTLDNFNLRSRELDRETADNLRRALALAQDYAVAPEGWLVYTGTYGCGKTHLAAAIANERVRQGYPALLVVVPDLLDHLRATFNPQSTVRYDKRFEEVRRAPLLVLDDLGTESATPWAKEKLFQLLNHRYVTHSPTIITTALPIENLDPKISIRIMDTRYCRVFAIKAPAYLGGEGGDPGPPKRKRSRRSSHQREEL